MLSLLGHSQTNKTQRKSHKENLTFEEEGRLKTYCRKEKVPDPSRLNVALCCEAIWSRWRCVKGGHLHIKEGLTSSQNNLLSICGWEVGALGGRSLHSPEVNRVPHTVQRISPQICSCRANLCSCFTWLLFFRGFFLVFFNWWLKATFLPVTAELCSSLTPEIQILAHAYSVPV